MDQTQRRVLKRKVPRIGLWLVLVVGAGVVGAYLQKRAAPANESPPTLQQRCDRRTEECASLSGAAQVACLGAALEMCQRASGQPDSSGLERRCADKAKQCAGTSGVERTDCLAGALELCQTAARTNAPDEGISLVPDEPQHGCNLETRKLMADVLHSCSEGACDLNRLRNTLDKTQHRELLARLPHVTLLFPAGSSRITPEHRRKIRKFLERPEVRRRLGGQHKMIILSRSSITGNRDYNETLSKLRAGRADAVVGELVRERGFGDTSSTFSAYLGSEANQISVRDAKLYGLAGLDTVRLNQSAQVFFYGCS